MSTYHVALVDDIILKVQTIAMRWFKPTRSLIITAVTTFYWSFTMCYEFWHVLYMNYHYLWGRYYSYSHLQIWKLKFRKVSFQKLLSYLICPNWRWQWRLTITLFFPFPCPWSPPLYHFIPFIKFSHFSKCLPCRW